MGKHKHKPGSAGNIRIIAGAWRGRRIAVAAGEGLRPTPDRVRETLFNWLAPILPGAVCLDLYAGTGALGFEALSRGAASCVMVEKDAAAATGIQVFAGSVDANVQLLRSDAARFLAGAQPASFDIVFVDPPYQQEIGSVLNALVLVLRPGGQVYLERDRQDPWPDHEAYQWRRQGNAGMVEFGLATLR